MTWPFGGLKPHAYRAICADPPWHFKSYTALQVENWSSRRDAGKHYEVMSLDAIAALPVRELAHPGGSHLFLWATGPCLRDAFAVMEAWGFKYSSVAFTWVKLRRSFAVDQFRLIGGIDESDLHVGLGLTTRKNAEFVLLGRRGNCRRAAKDVREIIMEPVREHSRKPDEMYARVERYCEGPYAELFSRETRAGWDAFGNEAGKFDVTNPEAA
jgi:N6-adenosine-specific RNA methylase IME4